ncbi:MAG: STAS domain-containing protein [Candidatus Eisenbacteria bacterium]|uniref:STAS domain-containing protein n=1 Tax=Eiseniibacteriota bacterium TaxID=2212470 RepID=A0A849SGY3_UNCEI|nr:STAS domain-containing protein [Candidatus Eisenbacteria bacterium]
MALKRREVRSIVVYSLRGSFFGDRETDELQKVLLDEAAAGNQHLVLNFSECDALNSVAIGVLMRAYANYKGRGGEIKLCGLGKRLQQLFVMMKLIMLFDHHETEEQAIASFAVGGNAPA